MPNLLYVLEVALAFGLVIFVHELGHFLAAKWCGVRVRKFALGFGPPLVRRRLGETEYSLRPIPLGGFVDLAGEHPEVDTEDDPRSLWRRPAWQRVLVFSAGVGMNVVLAVLLFTVASAVGVQVVAPVVGSVQPLSPAERAGIRPGDRIVRIDGEPITSFEDVQSRVVGEDAGTAFCIEVERRGEDGRPQRLRFDGVRSQRGPGDKFPRLGIAPAVEPVIARMLPGCPEAQAGLKEGDRILAVGGKPVRRWGEVGPLLEAAGPGPVTLTLERNGRRLDLTVHPETLYEVDLGMAPPLAVASVDPEGPGAEAGLQPGDLIACIEGAAWPTAEEVREAVRAAGGAGRTVRLVVLRDGERLSLGAAPRLWGEADHPRLGIAMQPALGGPVRIGRVDPDGPAAAAGLRPGDEILALEADGETVEPGTWEDVLAAFGKAAGRPVVVRVRRGAAELAARVVARRRPLERFALTGSLPGSYLYEPLPPVYNPLAAAWQGLGRAWVWLERVYTNFAQLLKGEVGTESLGGPVLIAKASYTLASRGLGTFLDFWGILSVCIAVINFLPLPPFDGGHVVFVAIETVKGGPVSLRVRNLIWGAGWAAVAALFLFITWQDISRLATW